MDIERQAISQLCLLSTESDLPKHEGRWSLEIYEL